MQPDHIYKDGSEISYKTGYEGSMTGGSLTSIGGHPITNNLGHTGELGFILIFNKLKEINKKADLQIILEVGRKQIVTMQSGRWCKNKKAPSQRNDAFWVVIPLGLEPRTPTLKV